MRRLLVLAGAVAMQICLGATYAWSVFVGPLRSSSGLLQGEAQIPFAVFYLAFPATTVAAGGILDRFGPRRSAIAGTLLFAAGWMLASLGAGSFLFTIAGIGLFGGVGVGLAYLVPIAVGVRWFPTRKGLVTGFAVAGFGGGAALVSLVAEELMHARGFSPFGTFALLGMFFAFLGGAGAAAMCYPSGAGREKGADVQIRDLLREPRFRILYAAMVAGLSAGFAVNANLTALLPAAAGAGAVSLFALANAGGRLAWGALSDRMSADAILSLNLMGQGIVLLGGIILPWLPGGPILFPLCVGFNYGGVLVLYASTTARLWGTGSVGRVYGLLFSANIVASPVPVLFGYGYDWTGSWTPGLAVLILGLASGIVLLRLAHLTTARRG
jgi:MFS transporter, OFA family, oxalate/formate antiporter